MADPLGSLRARAELRADSRFERRRRAKLRNAELRRSLLRPRYFVFAVVVVAAAVAALQLGRSLGADSTTRPANLGAAQVEGGRLALSGWSGWLPADTPSSLKDLLPGAKAARPLLLDGVTVFVGDVRDGDVPRLLSALRSTDANGTELSAGDLHVRSYFGRLVGHAPLTATLILVPTRAGVSAAICVGDSRRSTTAASDCESLLPTTVSLRHSDPTPASPDAASAAALTTAVRRLDEVRRADVRALATNRTSGRQAQAARRLNVAYARAARAIGGVSFTTLAATSAAALVKRLTSAADGYRALAAAAGEHSPTAFEQARARVVAADAALARSLVQLMSLGYGRSGS